LRAEAAVEGGPRNAIHQVVEMFVVDRWGYEVQLGNNKEIIVRWTWPGAVAAIEDFRVLRLPP
jgi:hypothetical protein